MVSLACSKCHRDLPITEFYIARGNINRHQRHSWCKSCVTSDNKRRRREYTPAERAEADRRNRGYSRKKKLAGYGLTPEDYDRMVAEQAGVCAICGLPERVAQPWRKEGVHPLAVDHDHATGKVRGLLCMMCNTAIGKLNDDPELLRKAADYLESHRTVLK